MQDSTAKQAGGEGLPGFGPDTIEAAMRERVRETIEAIVHEELEAALARGTRSAGNLTPVEAIAALRNEFGGHAVKPTA